MTNANSSAQAAYRWTRRLSIGSLTLGVLTAAATAVPISVTSQPATTNVCETQPILPPTLVDELGTVPFPTNERILAFEQTANGLCLPVVPAVRLDITNTVNPPMAFTGVWYVASQGTTFLNHDMLVNGAQAMKIDSLGSNQPLIFESSIANNVWEPGERWSFILDNWMNSAGLPAILIDTPGIAGITDINSTGSIIAIPVPEPVTSGLLSIGMLALVSRLNRRKPSWIANRGKRHR